MEIVSRLKKPLPGNSHLTRYVDIHGFLYFITQSKLRFARLDTFEDINEGFSAEMADAVRGFTDRSRNIPQTGDKGELMQEVARLKQQHSGLQDSYRGQQQSLFACCWYMGDKESVAMWNLYSNPDSVAIRFKAVQLIEIMHGIASKDDSHFHRMQYGVVEYKDLGDHTPRPDPEYIGFLKDDSFSHEQEFRFMAEKHQEGESLEYELYLGKLDHIDFTVISHPKMEEWKIRNILNVLSCYGLTEKFRPSVLALKQRP